MNEIKRNDEKNETSCKVLNAVLRDQKRIWETKKRISRTRRKWQDEQD